MSSINFFKGWSSLGASFFSLGAGMGLGTAGCHLISSAVEMSCKVFDHVVPDNMKYLSARLGLSLARYFKDASLLSTAATIIQNEASRKQGMGEYEPLAVGQFNTFLSDAAKDYSFGYSLKTIGSYFLWAGIGLFSYSVWKLTTAYRQSVRRLPQS